MQAIYSAASGIKNQQTRLDVIADNIANSNTAGYKKSRVDFKDALYTLMDSPVTNSQAGNLLTGSGVLVGATAADLTDGPLTKTGNTLDFAIQGKGYFTVEDASGQKYYTRNGSFAKSAEGSNTFLVTAQGDYVLDAAGSKIRLPADTEGLSVSGDGELSTTGGRVAALGIAEFDNPTGLLAAGGNLYQATAASGQPQTAADAAVVQGSLEGSNVDMSDELTLLIRAQRAYSLASKALQTADDMDGLSNNMRG